METGALVTGILLVLATWFVWVRGIVKGNRSDLITGFLLHLLINASMAVLAEVPLFFAFIGGLWLPFGMVTLVAGAFAAPSCPLRREHRITLGVLSMVLGILGGLIL